MAITFTFDKSVYRIGDQIQITLAGLTSGNQYKLRLFNSGTNVFKDIWQFVATGASMTIKLYVTKDWLNFDKIYADGDSTSLPSILNEVTVSPPTIEITSQLPAQVGSKLTYRASNLDASVTYVVAIKKPDGSYVYESDDIFSGVTEKLGEITVNLSAGNYQLILGIYGSIYEIASVSFGVSAPTVTQAPTLMSQVQDFINNIINFLKSNWLIVLIIIILLLFFL